LVADHALDPVRDTAGCVADANQGYGGVVVGPDIAALQAAAGSGATGIRVTTQVANGALKVAPQFQSNCSSDEARTLSSISDAAEGLTRPELFWKVTGADQADMLVSELVINPDRIARSVVIGDDPAVARLRQSKPAVSAFSVIGARACAADYRVSGLWGTVPKSCRNGTMLLTLDDIGFTLWGWPNRFLVRMNAANVRLIIAQDVVEGQIKGLTGVDQYGKIANSFNGYIWVDNIEELGPALRR
jgi:hypothetical protein